MKWDCILCWGWIAFNSNEIPIGFFVSFLFMSGKVERKTNRKELNIVVFVILVEGNKYSNIQIKLNIERDN